MRSLVFLGLVLGQLLGGQSLFAKQLVSAETIQLQKDSTYSFELSNKLPVTYRKLPEVDIFWVAVAFSYGQSSVSSEEATQLNPLAQLMEHGSLSYPREKLYSLFETYSTGVGCGFGVETGMCAMSFVNQYATDLLPVLSSLIVEPEFNSKEADLVIQQAKAANLAADQDPEDSVNELVNDLFYGKNHPYWRNSAFDKKVLDKLKLEDFRKLHAKLLKGSSKRLVVVSSLPVEEVKALLEKNFSRLSSKVDKIKLQKPPVFHPKDNFAFEDRDIPTAYIRAKFVLPGILDPDYLKSALMIHILSEELETEIRTRRSLSYSVFASQIPYTMGIGILHASTSKPTETLKAMASVLKKMQSDLIAREDLDRYKTVFATSYFLNLEDNGHLGSSLANSFHYEGHANKLYDFPVRLEAVTSEDIQKAARTYLRQFRLAVVYKKAAFEKKAAQDFLKAFP